MSIPAPISILIAEELTLLREGIAALCAARPGLTVGAQCADGLEAVTAIRRIKPHVSLLDSHIARLPALELLHLLQKEGEATRVILMASKADRQLVPEALRLGAYGIILKSGSSGELLDAVEAAMDGRVYLAPSLQVGSLSYFGEELPDALAALSPREYQVFSLMVEGVRAKEIAGRLGLSPKTVDTYRSSLMRKLDIHDMAGLVKFAIQRKLIAV